MENICERWRQRGLAVEEGPVFAVHLGLLAADVVGRVLPDVCQRGEFVEPLVVDLNWVAKDAEEVRVVVRDLLRGPAQCVEDRPPAAGPTAAARR